MKKIWGKNLNAGKFSENFTETVKSFISKDEAYIFMSSINGTPAYRKKFLRGFGYGKTSWTTRFFGDTELCWFKVG